MKLPSYLAKSRHGIYYFRLTFRVGFSLKEKRISLRTKNPQEARFKASCLSGIMAVRKQEPQKAMATDHFNTAEHIAGQTPDSDFLLNLLRRTDHQKLAEVAGMSVTAINDLFDAPEEESDFRKMDIEMPGGFALRNIHTDEDMNRAVHILQTLNLSPEALAKLITSNPNPVPIAPVPASEPVVPKTDEAGTTIQEMVPRFASRKRGKLAPKTHYEYGNYHAKFVEWLEVRKKKKHIPVHSITRADMADYIDDLLAKGVSPRTITQKYLAAINGLFALAKTIGVLPEDRQLVSHGHQVYTKADVKKNEIKNGYKPFTVNELKLIFQPQLLTDAQRPADFWLPMLGLFTGGRISELAQLDVTDIQLHGDIWAISINEEEDKSLKTVASNRLIPVHPTLLDCGFLDYVNDAQKHGRKLFPYLWPDAFGSYGGTPGDRFGRFLDKLGIKDKKKVFHSFRSTSNNRLKQNKVSEESRCQFVGHEHDTVNSATYSDPHQLEFLLNEVAVHLTYPALDFTSMKYTQGYFDEMLGKLCAKKASIEAHKTAKERLGR